LSFAQREGADEGQKDDDPACFRIGAGNAHIRVRRSNIAARNPKATIRDVGQDHPREESV